MIKLLMDDRDEHVVIVLLFHAWGVRRQLQGKSDMPTTMSYADGYLSGSSV
jgi:hypothetical protein